MSFGASDWEMHGTVEEQIERLREGEQPRGESMTTAAAPAVAAPAATAAPVRRMSLAAVVKGKIHAPYRLTVHGPDGVGKSTFAASAPKPIFLGPEDGTSELDTDRFPVPDGGLTWADCNEAPRVLANEKHDYKTFIVDTLDWAEPLLFAHVVARDTKAKTIEDVGGGFGRGYLAALDGWRSFLAGLEALQAKTGMHVILLAHSFIKNFKNPEGEDFDRYVLKLHDKSAALVREWSKGVYFANYETFAVKEKGERAAKGVGGSNRVLYTQRKAAYDAKDRYGLPTKLPLNWDEFEKLAKAGSDPVALKAEIEKLAKDAGGDIEKTGLEYLSKAGTKIDKLAQVKDWLVGKTNEKAEKEAA